MKKETGFIALSALIGSLLLQAGFVLLRQWDYTVLLGGMVGWLLATGNFYLMCCGIRDAVSMDDPDRAQRKIKASYTWRTLLMLGVMTAAFLLPFLHWIPVVAAVFYPQISILIRQAAGRFLKKDAGVDTPNKEGDNTLWTR